MDSKALMYYGFFKSYALFFEYVVPFLTAFLPRPVIRYHSGAATQTEE